MICPRCNSNLSRKIVQTCEVNCCMECDGIWVSKETFCRLANIISFDLKMEDNRKTGLFKAREIKKSSEADLKKICPQCKIGMRKYNFAYDSNIFLDKCSKCGGIWADVGEMIEVARHIKPDMDMMIIGKGIIENPYLKQFEEDSNKMVVILQTILRVMMIFS